MMREGIRLGLVGAIVAGLVGELPWILFVFVAGYVPGLWWSTSAWESDDVDDRVSLGVVLVASALVAALPWIRWDLGLVPALWLGTQTARLRVIPGRVDTVSAETWARRNAHRYKPGRPVPAPDLSSSDPYVLITGAGRGRQVLPDPYDGVPDEHQRFVRGGDRGDT
jgi:hypothetical protein